MSKALKALEILKENKRVMENFVNSFDNNCKEDDEYISANKYIHQLNEALEELEQYEQNFNQKEFDYRTQCQKVLSTERLAVIDMPDRLVELEKVILDYYLDKGYQVGVGNWNFKVEIISRWKSKYIAIRFYENNQEALKYIQTSNTTKEMLDEAIDFFSTRQNEVVEKKQSI